MRPIPLGVRDYKQKSLPVSAQAVVNMWIDVLDPDAKTRTVAYLRPGKTLKTTLAGGKVRGFGELNNVLYAVAGNTLYSIDSNWTAISIGTIPGSGNVSMATNLVGQLMIVNGTTTGYVYDGSTLTSVTLPGAAYTVDHSDGYLLFDYNDTENWFVSSNTDATSFDATETGATNDRPDKVLRVIRAQNRVIVFCESSIEGFYVVTTLDFPYSKDRGVSLKKGTRSRWSVALEDETLFWLGDDLQVYMMRGLQSQRISSPSISYQISQLTTHSDAEGYAFTLNDHTFYVLTFPTDRKTFVYDLSNGFWYQWGKLNNGVVEEEIGYKYYRIYDSHVIGDDSGNVYVMDDTVYTDNGSLIKWEIVTPPIHNNQDTFTLGEIRVGLEPGIGLTTGQGSNPQLFLSKSDDAKIYYSERWNTPGKIGEYKNKVRFHRNGRITDYIIYKLSGTDPVKWAINGLWVDI